MGCRTTKWQLASGLALSSASAILELLQTLVPGRTPEITGFAASSLGTWLGLALAVGVSAIPRGKK